VSTNPKPLLG